MTTVGIDEVGRGCWAGPVVAGAVILSEPIAGLKDSKKLSKNQRQLLFTKIYAKAQAIGLGWVDAPLIDKMGISQAVKLAMQQALDQIKIDYDEVIIDGSLNFLSKNPYTRAVIKADDSIPSVSAASIVAKVARDQYMTKIAANYQAYGFERHVGYGTELHLKQLMLHGPSNLHRRSFKPMKTLW